MSNRRHSPRHKNAHRIGGWLPQNRETMRRYVHRVVEKAKSANVAPADYIAPVQGLSNLIQTTPVVYMLFSEMLSEVPAAYNKDPSGQPEIQDIYTLLATLNQIATNSIPYNDSAQIGTPINAILDWPMGTKAGFAAFLRDDVNNWIQQILQSWGQFLTKSASLTYINADAGNWLSVQAQNDPESPGLKDFANTYVCDPSAPHWGFLSWDDFFTRKFKPNLRPVASPDDPSVITSAAESTPFMIQENVQLQNTFWAKDQAYALDYLLGDPIMAQKFVGGTVYQAFLSADSYHNWHAPVCGKYIQPPGLVAGTYYSEPLIWGSSPDKNDPPSPDPGADAKSQGYISCVAKRGVAFIQPDDESLGLIALIMIGMAEVSSIQFDQISNNHFNKGDMIGRFHFGGSTHCLVFGPGVKFTPVPEAEIVDPTHVNLNTTVIKVCSELGTLTPVNK